MPMESTGLCDVMRGRLWITRVNDPRENPGARRRHPAWLGRSRATFSEPQKPGQGAGREAEAEGRGEVGPGDRGLGGPHSYICTDLGSRDPWWPGGPLWPRRTLCVKVKGSVCRWGLPITPHPPLHLEAAVTLTAPFPPSQVRPCVLGEARQTAPGIG